MMRTVAIVCAKRLRHRRVAERAERAFDREAINERDWSEIENLEKGGPIAIADYYISNEGSIGELREKMEEVAREVGVLE